MIDLKSIPDQPGCYIYTDKNKEIIYIGKAKNLKKRVSSYFQKGHLDPKTAMLVSKIDSVDYIITKNEVDALILENNLVKKHQPKYNIDLKDGKRYAYVELTKEEFPMVLLARDRKDDATYFGPMTSGQERDMIIETINKHFGLRTCRKLPKRECIRYHIHLCKAPCTGKISKEEYRKLVEDAKFILKGETSDLMRMLKRRMDAASEKQEYEKALELRDQVSALGRLKEHQAIELNKRYDQDIICSVVKDDKVYVLLFNVYQGMLINKKDFIFDMSEMQEDFFEEFLLRYYSENDIPEEIISDKPIDASLLEFFSGMKKKKVRGIVPEKGDKKELLDLALKNIEVSFFGNLAKLDDLKTKLKLQDTPAVIECFDISHLSGTAMVGSMVSFRNGIAYKSGYRRFKIKTLDKIDDFAAIAEVVRRRYTRIMNEKQDNPNLIIIDGGLGQLHAAMDELNKLNLKIPIISIAKRLEEIYVPGLRFPLRLDKKDKALQLIQAIRDEAHRFAITYNKLLRKKKLLDEE